MRLIRSLLAQNVDRHTVPSVHKAVTKNEPKASITRLVEESLEQGEQGEIQQRQQHQRDRQGGWPMMKKMYNPICSEKVSSRLSRCAGSENITKKSGAVV